MQGYLLARSSSLTLSCQRTVLSGVERGDHASAVGERIRPPGAAAFGGCPGAGRLNSQRFDLWGSLRSVDGWSLATRLLRLWGLAPSSIRPAVDVTGAQGAPSWDLYVIDPRRPQGDGAVCDGPGSRKFNRGNRMALGECVWHSSPGRAWNVPLLPTTVSASFGSATQGPYPAWAQPWATTVTWLILPVVICLSQRLSHACPSISNLYCETANGS